MKFKMNRFALFLTSVVLAVTALSCIDEDSALSNDSAEQAINVSTSVEALDGEGLLAQGRLTDSDSEYAIVPGGFRVHKSCIHEVPGGAFIDKDGTVSVDGNVLRKLSPCRYARKPLLKQKGNVPTVNGWIEASYVYAPYNANGSWFSQIGVNFTVPAAPTSQEGQIVYLFPGLEPSAGNAILQPVLQWGVGSMNGGGYSWGMSSWYIPPTGSVVYSPLQPVNVGDTITGYVYQTGSACGVAGTNCRWVASWSVNGGSVPSTQYIWVWSPVAYSLAFLGALEAYNLNSCAGLPSSGSTTFSLISLYQPGAAPAVTWNAWVPGGTPWCSYSVNNTGNNAVFNY